MLDCAYLILLCSCKTNVGQIESVVYETGTSYSFSSQPDLYLLETACAFLEPLDVRVEQVQFWGVWVDAGFSNSPVFSEVSIEMH